ncbi:5'-nucleotidase [Luteococcus sp. OSA5]|uniref:5'-nucleotidase n=1 Tax=Luteococcus sp. OSA5 TaxID=3401630 RepID=UPI003B42DDCA
MSTPDLNESLVVGVASSALFDLSESDRVFREQGVVKYEEFQAENQHHPLEPGIAFPFIQRLLGLNALQENLVEVIVMSRNSPASGLRVMDSIKHHDLPISRAIFRRGLGAEDFMSAFNMSLFLSANEADVRHAIEAGQPAGQVMTSSPLLDHEGESLRIAFDFDGVLADDSAEQVYQSEGMEEYQRHEASRAEIPLTPGPLYKFLQAVNKIQTAEDKAVEQDRDYKRRLRVSLVTARNAPAHERAIRSLMSWGLQVDDAFFLGGLPKSTVLNVLKPHIFFDDQQRHFEGVSAPAVYVPFGELNKTAPSAASTAAADSEQED